MRLVIEKSISLRICLCSYASLSGQALNVHLIQKDIIQKVTKMYLNIGTGKQKIVFRYRYRYQEKKVPRYSTQVQKFVPSYCTQVQIPRYCPTLVYTNKKKVSFPSHPTKITEGGVDVASMPPALSTMPPALPITSSSTTQFRARGIIILFAFHLFTTYYYTNFSFCNEVL